MRKTGRQARPENHSNGKYPLDRFLFRRLQVRILEQKTTVRRRGGQTPRPVQNEMNHLAPRRQHGQQRRTEQQRPSEYYPKGGEPESLRPRPAENARAQTESTAEARFFSKLLNPNF